MARVRKIPRKPGTPRQEAWWRSARFRAHARGLAMRNNAERAQKPKCSATAKLTGQPCRNPALPNGKCRYHGGRTPKGDQWHKMQYPNGRSPDAEEKLARKLRDHERKANRRSFRCTCMTPEERAAHEQWQKTHRSGSAGKRAQERFRRDHAVDVQRLMAQPDPPKSPETIQLEKDIARARELLAALAAKPPQKDRP